MKAKHTNMYHHKTNPEFLRKGKEKSYQTPLNDCLIFCIVQILLLVITVTLLLFSSERSIFPDTQKKKT
jgi:hypothetical protein